MFKTDDKVKDVRRGNLKYLWNDTNVMTKAEHQIQIHEQASNLLMGLWLVRSKKTNGGSVEGLPMNNWVTERHENAF